jgi:hypothetical protein
MKKKTTKSLSVKKTTLTHLNAAALRALEGGISGFRCESRNADCSFGTRCFVCDPPITF